MSEQKNPVAEIKMAKGGTMKVELYPDKTPITVANFVDLANSGYYNGLSFHRVVSGFVIQGGSKNNSCAGEDAGFTIKGEFAINGVDTGLKHDRGVISMARSGHPDSASTQFFICHADAGFLDNQYAAFGKVVEGLDVLDQVAASPVRPGDPENKPIDLPIIESITIVPNGYAVGEVVRITK